MGTQLFRANGWTYVTNFEKVPQVALWQHIFTSFDRTFMNCEQDSEGGHDTKTDSGDVQCDNTLHTFSLCTQCNVMTCDKHLSEHFNWRY